MPGGAPLSETGALIVGCILCSISLIAFFRLVIQKKNIHTRSRSGAKGSRTFHFLSFFLLPLCWGIIFIIESRIDVLNTTRWAVWIMLVPFVLALGSGILDDIIHRRKVKNRPKKRGHNKEADPGGSA